MLMIYHTRNTINTSDTSNTSNTCNTNNTSYTSYTSNTSNTSNTNNMSDTSINPSYTIDIDIDNIDHVKTLRIQCYNCDSSCGFERSNRTLTASSNDITTA